ncbi:MAG TPA: MBL fold metallo-hydrolase [Steroidobacteraceae bacterium]|nr:MBL fold metallo-hydrolase [Steroidobacteraceae bacterium]
MSNRRQFLHTLAVGAAGYSFARAGLRPAMAKTADTLTVTPLTDDLLLITGAGANVVALSQPEGVLLVDGGDAEHSAALLRTVSEATGGRKVVTAFNTHWHWPHTGSNEALRKAGAKIIAHENTRLWLTEPVIEEWEHRTYPPRPKALPTETFYKGAQTLNFGKARVDYGYLPQAHTDGDIYVHFRDANVLVAGDVVAVGHYPILDYVTGGWSLGMANATRQLLDLVDDQVRIVPGTGPLQTKADLAAEHEMLATLHEDLWQLMRKGLGADDMIAAHATGKFDDKWGNPDLFIANAYRGLYGHVRELRGVV